MALSVTQLSGFGGAGSPDTLKLIDIIRFAGATANLNMCVDAGDSASTNGTSQTWSDVSGNGNDWFRGSNSGVEGTDPTFNGSAGDLSSATYWSFGSKFFSWTAARTYSDAWHQNNGAFTIIAVYFPKAAKTIDGLIFANRNSNAAEDGVMFGVNSTNKLYAIKSLTNTTSETLTSTATVTGGRFEFLAVSYDEASNSMEFRINSTSETPTTSTSTNNSTAARADAISRDYAASEAYFEATERLVCTAHWSRKLTSGELTTIYEQLKTRLALP